MRDKHVRFIVIIILWMSTIHPIPSHAQTIPQTKLTGRITDASTGQPLYFANVFLSNTTLGCATDKEGNYTIENVPSGHYELVASMIGYQLQSMTIDLKEPIKRETHFQLAPVP
ncbi:MAG: carboxypeptidase-like regulatory domain-containing protein, partial [bacterium]